MTVSMEMIHNIYVKISTKKEPIRMFGFTSSLLSCNTGFYFPVDYFVYHFIGNIKIVTLVNAETFALKLKKGWVTTVAKFSSNRCKVLL